MSGASGIDPSRLRRRIVDELGVSPLVPWFVAYSGGLDSTVLLHLLARIGAEHGVPPVALHADHGLSDQAPAWREHCQRQCAAWGIECRVTRLRWDAGAGAGPEGGARDARYRWLRAATGGAGWLFTAHHRGDQAETLIERLSRGAGPRGLRGMRPVARLYGMQVARPLLDTPRADIEAHARHWCLDWVTDDSNAEAYFTRNYIRHQVLPALRRRWPAIEASLAQTAGAMADAEAILREAAARDLAGLHERVIRADPSLDVQALRALPPARRRNVLRDWVDRRAGVSLPRRRLLRLVRAVADWPVDRGGLRWPPLELRLYQGRLYLLRPFEAPAGAACWSLERDLVLSRRLVLRARPVLGRGLKPALLRRGVRVAFRQGGEKCRLPGRAHRHTLKQVLQEAAVPPWQRARIPLIYSDGEIAAIAGLSACAPFAAGEGEEGLEIEPCYGPDAGSSEPF